MSSSETTPALEAGERGELARLILASLKKHVVQDDHIGRWPDRDDGDVVTLDGIFSLLPVADDVLEHVRGLPDPARDRALERLSAEVYRLAGLFESERVRATQAERRAQLAEQRAGHAENEARVFASDAAGARAQLTVLQATITGTGR